MKVINKRLKHIIHASGLTQTEIADIMGVQKATISQFITRGTTPSGCILLGLSVVLKCDPFAFCLVKYKGKYMYLDELESDYGVKYKRDIIYKAGELLKKGKPVDVSALRGKRPNRKKRGEV